MTQGGGPTLSANRRARVWATVKHALPRGKTLPEDAWERRHRAMLAILWAHVPALFVFARLRGYDMADSVGPVVPIALAGEAAVLRGPGRRARSLAVAIGLLTSPGVLV